MQKIPFHRKRPDSSNDYQLAYDTILSIEAGKPVDIYPDNIPAFRKYAYDLAAKNNMNIRTSKLSDSQLRVYRLE